MSKRSLAGKRILLLVQGLEEPCAWLRSRGLDVSEAHTEDEALEEARHSSFDLLILDLEPGPKERLRFISSIKENHPHLRVLVAASGGIWGSDLVHRGIDDWVLKPFKEREFISRVKFNLARCALREKEEADVRKSLEIETEAQYAQVLHRKNQELDKALRELRILFESSSCFNSTMVQKEIYNTFLERARLNLDIKNVYLFLFEEEDERKLLFLAHKSDEARRKELTDDVLQEWASVGVESRRSHLVEDLEAGISLRRPVLLGIGGSLMILPMVVREVVLGVVLIHHPRAFYYMHGDFQFMETLVNQMAIAISNARQFEHILSLARTDGLTGALNHRCFHENLDRILSYSRRHKSCFSMVFLDIDFFKRVNDNYGHQVGDVVLKRVSRILRENIRKEDLLARYGGEEFAIIFPRLGNDNAPLVCEKLRQIVEGEVFRVRDLELRITISLGCATYPLHAENKMDLIEQADAALYRAKAGGRNMVCVSESIREFAGTEEWT